MDKLREYCLKELPKQNFDSLALSIIDFKSGSFSSLEFFEAQETLHSKVFDLASLTKPLVLGVSYLSHQNLFSEKMHLLLEHRSGLKAWARLSSLDWRSYINSLSVESSRCLYSDLGALRLQCELEKKLQGKLEESIQNFWDDGLCFWKNLPKSSCCVETGFRRGSVIKGEVHDDNAFNLSEFCSHAGLFSTIQSLSKTLLILEDQFHFVSFVGKEALKDSTKRFILGWDRSLDPKSSLSGKHECHNMFGHLGFTGTSIWIDPNKKRGYVLLTNATQNYWFERDGLNKMRRDLGELIWKEDA